MTGQKNRFKTHEKLWNIDDKQLKTPKHDALVLWLMDENNLKQYFGDIRLYSDDEQVPTTKKYDNHIEDKIRIDSEIPIKSSSTFIAGYGDISVLLKRKRFHSSKPFPLSKEWVSKIYSTNYVDELLDLVKKYTENDGADLKHYAPRRIEFEIVDGDISDRKIYTKQNYYSDFYRDELKLIDFMWSVGISFDPESFVCGRIRAWANGYLTSVDYNTFRILIEVKPYVDSFGAVLRQIKSYRTFTQYDEYWLFTLDDRFDVQFESQGIRVIHPPDDFDLYEYMSVMGLD